MTLSLEQGWPLDCEQLEWLALPIAVVYAVRFVARDVRVPTGVYVPGLGTACMFTLSFL